MTAPATAYSVYRKNNRNTMSLAALLPLFMNGIPKLVAKKDTYYANETEEWTSIRSRMVVQHHRLNSFWPLIGNFTLGPNMSE